MKELSDARKRTLALQDRALQFSHAVNRTCPADFSNVPSSTVWHQLVRAADSTSNNLIEADAASSGADFLNKMAIALREAKNRVRRGVESEAKQLAAIFATIIINMRARLARERAEKDASKQL